MHLTSEAYQNVTEYLAKLYEVSLYTVNDVAHPVIFYPSAESQREDIDSVLGWVTNQKLTEDDFYIYDYGYLHSLQNSKRQLFNGQTFALKRLRTNPLKIDAVLGNYFDMLATCYAMEQELFDSAESKFIRLPLRSQFHREISPKNSLTDGRGRSSAIGGVGLVVFNHGGEYQAIVSQRQSSHATNANSYHLLPAFMFQPMSDTMREGEWSIQHHFYREWLEEFFSMEESDSMDFYDHPAMLDLKDMSAKGLAKLYLTGVAYNLLTLRPEICVLLLIQDDTWWERINAPDSPIKLTLSETKNQLLTVPIVDDEKFFASLPEESLINFVPQGIPALIEGVKLAREKLNI